MPASTADPDIASTAECRGSSSEDEEGEEEEEEAEPLPLVDRREIWGYDDTDDRNQCRKVRLTSDASCAKLSPSSDHLATASVDGRLDIYSCSLQRCVRAAQLCRRRASSCRALEYSGDGGWLFSGWSDGAVRVHDLTTGRLRRRCPTRVSSAADDAENDESDEAVSCVMPYTANLMATGHDDGTVSVWDYRCVRSVMCVKQCEDTITDLVVDSCQRWLAATSDEGTLTAFCLRTHRVHTQCDMYDAALTGMALIKGGAKVAVAVSSDKGSVNVFNWGHFDEHISVFKDHPSAATSIAAVSDSLVAVGYDDGSIRLCNILPHKYVGVIGRHRPALPVECISVSGDGSLLSSCAHDRHVLLWSVDYAHADRYSRRFGSAVKRKHLEKHERRSRGDMKRALPSCQANTVADFFSDLPKEDRGCFFWE